MSKKNLMFEDIRMKKIHIFFGSPIVLGDVDNEKVLYLTIFLLVISTTNTLLV